MDILLVLLSLYILFVERNYFFKILQVLVEEEEILDLIEPQPKPIINFNVALNYILEIKHLLLSQGIDSVEIEVVEDICLSQKIKNIKQSTLAEYFQFDS